MRAHGRGPKDVFVRKHAKWVKGERLHVGNHLRGTDPKPANKPAKEQLDLFEPENR